MGEVHSGLQPQYHFRLKSFFLGSLILKIQKFPNMLEPARIYLQMNYDNMHSWDISPHACLHLKQIHRLTKAWGKAVILNMKGKKYVFEPYMT